MVAWPTPGLLSIATYSRANGASGTMTISTSQTASGANYDQQF